jgi:hypothetical protein
VTDAGLCVVGLLYLLLVVTFLCGCWIWSVLSRNGCQDEIMIPAIFSFCSFVTFVIAYLLFYFPQAPT